LYFYPPTPLKDESEIVLGVSDLANGNRPFIRSGSRSELHDVRFEGFTVTYGGSREAMAILNATRVEVVNLIISNFNRNALIFQGQHSVISGLRSSGMGCSVVSANGGNTQTLQTSNVTIRDSELFGYGRWVRSYSAGVHFGGGGVNVFHNKIHSAPHTGLLGYGVLHTFTQNTLYNLLYGSSDAGAFYIGRSWVDRGMVVDGNVFYDLNVIEPTTCPIANQMVHGIYLDDEQSGVVVKGNLCRNCTNGIIVGGGRHNSVLGNRCEGISAAHPQTQRSCVHFDNRGMNWQHSACSNSSGQPGLLIQQLYQVDYQQPPYSFAFPDIVNTLKDRPCVPVENVFIGNSYCGLGEFLTATAADVAAWGSYAAENTEDYNC
jgi:parallel beta-helix repeat protein